MFGSRKAISRNFRVAAARGALPEHIIDRNIQMTSIFVFPARGAGFLRGGRSVWALLLLLILALPQYGCKRGAADLPALADMVTAALKSGDVKKFDDCLPKIGPLADVCRKYFVDQSKPLKEQKAVALNMATSLITNARNSFIDVVQKAGNTGLELKKAKLKNKQFSEYTTKQGFSESRNTLVITDGSRDMTLDFLSPKYEGRYYALSELSWRK